MALQRGPPSPGLANLKQRLKNIEMSPAALQVTKFMKVDPDDPLSPATPHGKRKGTWDEDCCSTALPSPWAGPDSPSPWPSPAPSKWASSPAPAHGTPGSFRPQASVSCATFVPSDLAGCLEQDFVEALALRLPPVPEGSMRPGSPCDSDMVFSPDSWNSMTSPPLWNPMAPLVDSEMHLTPPTSPLVSSRDVAPFTPYKPVRSRSPRAPCKAAVPRLLSALQCWDLSGVRQALENDPECAQFPFWEHALEPPLCAAVRLGCGAEIIELLIAHGAAVRAVDAKGRAPLDILKADTCRWGAMPFNDELVDGGRIAALLTRAGAQESASGAEHGASESEETSFAGEGHRTPLPAMPQFYTRSATPRKLF